MSRKIEAELNQAIEALRDATEIVERLCWFADIAEGENSLSLYASSKLISDARDTLLHAQHVLSLYVKRRVEAACKP